MLGLRVVRALEMPSDKAEVFTDASGRATTVAKLDNTGVNGVYLTSEGKKGEAAWGTRGRWCNLSGKIGDEPVTITILDHPAAARTPGDRKSTRLNSSHGYISYAVFCLKKKKRKLVRAISCQRPGETILDEHIDTRSVYVSGRD